MTFRKHYKTSGARLVYGVDGGAPAPVSRPFPNGTLTSVPCPDCPALVKQRCRSNTSGKEMASVHISRRRIAIRRYRAELQEQADD